MGICVLFGVLGDFAEAGLEALAYAGGGEGGSADGIDLVVEGFLDAEAVPRLEIACIGHAVYKAGGLAVGEQLDADDAFLAVEGDAQGGFSVVAAYAVGGRLAVGYIAEDGAFLALDFGPRAFVDGVAGFGEDLSDFVGYFLCARCHGEHEGCEEDDMEDVFHGFWGLFRVLWVYRMLDYWGSLSRRRVR